MNPDGWITPHAWCYRRVQPALSRGELGNAFGLLRADLARSSDTSHLIPILDATVTDLASLHAFINEHLKVSPP